MCVTIFINTPPHTSAPLNPNYRVKCVQLKANRLPLHANFLLRHALFFGQCNFICPQINEVIVSLMLLQQRKSVEHE